MATYVAVFSLVLAYFSLVAAFLALRQTARMRRSLAIATRGGRAKESLLEATERHIALSQAVADQLSSLRSYVDATRAEAVSALRTKVTEDSGSLRNLGLVRYDAFEDMAGRMSFSLALLDDRGDGLTMSAIAGHTDTRVYAKPVAAGRSEHELSPEEQEAIKAALRRPTMVARKKAS